MIILLSSYYNNFLFRHILNGENESEELKIKLFIMFCNKFKSIFDWNAYNSIESS